MTKLNQFTGAAIFAIAMAAAPAFAGKGEKHFKEIDANGDGKITSEEFNNAGATKFTSADANGDGVLTKGELVGFMVDEKGKSARKAEKKTDKKMAKMDANEDGSLTKQEFTDAHGKWFAEMDKNGDGALSMDEMKRHH
ncbi:MAG TPA: EF-hand domain-containing protein [Bdellovibrionales bacterium]|nr:EF-hand domain-containing protein [Bdellovibrionales bacterium]